jgi:hypothetical protein
MDNPGDIGNIGYKNGQSRRHRQHWVQEWTIQETSATLHLQDTGRKQTKQKTKQIKLTDEQHRPYQ